MKPTFTSLNYTYKKTDSDVWVLNFDDVPVDKSLIIDQQLVHLAPKSVGGNHKHPRTEWFVGIGDLQFVWLDKSGKIYTRHMHPQGQILLIEVPPYLPHAVVNRSSTERGMLFEFSDGKQVDVESVEIVSAESVLNIK